MLMKDIHAGKTYLAYVGKQPPLKTKVVPKYVSKDGRWCVETVAKRDIALVKADAFIKPV